MTDEKFRQLLEKTRKELHRRYSTKMCKELHGGCPDCQVRFLIGLINDKIDQIDWWKRKFRKKHRKK